MRGKILRDTAVGDGVIFLNGEQKTFSLEKWRSAEAPRINDVVDVELNSDGSVMYVSLVDETVLVKEKAKQTTDLVASHGANAFNLAIAKIGLPTLGLVAGLLVLWLFFNFIAFKMYGESLGITLYDLMKLANSPTNVKEIAMGAGSAGGYGVLLWLAALAPLGAHFLKDKRGWLLYCVPLVFTFLILIVGYNKVNSAMQMASGIGNAYGMGSYMTKIKDQFWDGLSFGLGFYATFILAGYMAFLGIKNFLGRR